MLTCRISVNHTGQPPRPAALVPPSTQSPPSSLSSLACIHTDISSASYTRPDRYMYDWETCNFAELVFVIEAALHIPQHQFRLPHKSHVEPLHSSRHIFGASFCWSVRVEMFRATLTFRNEQLGLGLGQEASPPAYRQLSPLVSSENILICEIRKFLGGITEVIWESLAALESLGRDDQARRSALLATSAKRRSAGVSRRLCRPHCIEKLASHILEVEPP